MVLIHLNLQLVRRTGKGQKTENPHQGDGFCCQNTYSRLQMLVKPQADEDVFSVSETMKGGNEAAL